MGHIGVWWGGSCRAGVGHAGVGWVMLGRVGIGGSCRDGLGHGGVAWVM